MKSHSLRWATVFRALGMGTGWVKGGQQQNVSSISSDTELNLPKIWKISKAGFPYCLISFWPLLFSWCNSASHLKFLRCLFFKAVSASNFLTPLFSWSAHLSAAGIGKLLRKKEPARSIRTSPALSLLSPNPYTQ